VIDLIRTLDSEKELGFSDDLLALLQGSRNPKLRAAIFAFFADLELKTAEKEALDVVATRDRQDQGLVSAALLYLAQLKSKAALAYADAIIKDDDKKILPSLLKLLGRAGGKDEEELLIKWLEGDAPSEDLKQAAIQALGDFGSAKAAERLMKIVEDSGQGKATRMFACDALAKIHDKRSVASLVIAANGEDPNVRGSALGALASFDGGEASQAILAGLRDSTALVRTAACKAAAKALLSDAVPALVYKASNDPEKAVKTEAFKALGDIGGKEAFAFLRKYLEDAKSDSAGRVLVFGLLLKKDKEASGLLERRLAAEAKEKDRGLFTAYAREVANVQDAPQALGLARILESDTDYLIRIAALDWARKNKSPDFRADLARLAEKDPSDYVRKKAAEALASY
jgi:HEAT repeat protein